VGLKPIYDDCAFAVLRSTLTPLPPYEGGEALERGCKAKELCADDQVWRKLGESSDSDVSV